MKISDWLEAQEISDSDLAERIGVSRQALYRYKAGHRTPRPSIIHRIREATNGAVTADDFLPDPKGEVA